MRLKKSGKAVIGLGALLTGAIGLARQGYAPASSPQALTRPTQPEAVAIVVAQVRRQAQRTEPQEGAHDLVKDSVKIKPGPPGQAVLEQVGEASVYGRAFRGKRMANGRRFNPQGRTAAHPSLPLGTQAKVTNLETGKAVQVHITDRGPYAKGRDLDLSPAAARAIGLTQKEGEAPVKIEATLPLAMASRTVAAASPPRQLTRRPSPGHARGRG